MQARRIIPCLDMKNGRVVKGINFVGLKDVGDPVECAKNYEQQGADEIVFLDISATNEKRATMVDVVKKTAESLSVPLAVGGGIRNLDDFGKIFSAGAGKVSVNTVAVNNPEIISQAAKKFGSEKVVSAIDYKKVEGDNCKSIQRVIINGGEKVTELDVISWAKEVENLGAGEILLTSLDADGTKEGFDLYMLNAVAEAVKIPVIASGGGGSIDDFVSVFKETSVDAALAASVFHYGELTVKDIKKKLREEGIPVNI